ncbi:hypothetical protein BC938DRAFT_475756 [Jimgerdemannia flammicorona]|uniref:Rhodanese domain-containing protein n=1 Tax=Jimgerdemannia flammicorona TaxID=994334 RepID=A0A433PP84_9FUNG|nr:hypothetical protein BC938DRAFT_475756 [Jimgerdemannia flammicorona]
MVTALARTVFNPHHYLRVQPLNVAQQLLCVANHGNGSGFWQPIDRARPPSAFHIHRLMSTCRSLEERLEKYRSVSFYAIHPLRPDSIHDLKTTIRSGLASLDTLGRVYIAAENGGINAQLSVPMDKVSGVTSFFNDLMYFKGVRFEYNFGTEDTLQPAFKKLKVMVKKQLVADGMIHNYDLSNQPTHLDAAEWHEQLSTRGTDAFLIDMRNHYEYEIGRFVHARKMDVDTFQEGMKELDNVMAARSQDEEIYMYCTGGIRCSVAGAYLRSKGFNNVKMRLAWITLIFNLLAVKSFTSLCKLKGGITSYAHHLRQNPHLSSLFKGKNFTFDDRRGEPVSSDILAHCHQCGAPCDTMRNCANTLCHLLYVQCEACKRKNSDTCSELCRNILEGSAEWRDGYDYHRQIRPNKVLSC